MADCSVPCPSVKMFTKAGRAAIFDRSVYTEAFFDDDTMADGALVVAAVGALTYLGILVRFGRLGAFSVTDLFAVLIGSIASWLILGFATWFAATRLFNASTRPQTLIGLQGLAALPLLLDILGSPISWIGFLWYLAVLVLATKEGAELDFRTASVVVLIGAAAAALVRALLGVPFGLLSGVFA